MITTLNKIRELSPCAEGWAKLLKHLNKTKADDEPIRLLTILDSNGLDDAIWCMRAVDGANGRYGYSLSGVPVRLGAHRG